MYVVGFNGSARIDGNTAAYLRKTFEPLEAEGIECELVQLAGQVVRGCTACGFCREEGNDRCVQTDDIVNECIDKMERADAIIIASPVYFADVSAETKALIDRAGYVTRGNDTSLSRKIGAGIAVARRAGTIHAIDSINHFFLINDMIVMGSSYWNIGLAKAKGDAENDTEGLQTMYRLGENIAWLLKKIHN